MTLGLAAGKVELKDSSAQYAASFGAERARLLHALGGLDVRLEHIGSTAVPGLIAKPVLDLALGYPAGVPFEGVGTVLEALGYRFRDDAGAAGGLVYLLESAGLRTHSLHLVRLDDPQWAAWLGLRDLLRHSADARAEYAAVKAALARQFPGDRRAYTDGKSAVIRRLLEHTK